MFTYTYETRYGDYKNFDEIKPSALLDMVQDVAIRHSDFLGYGLLDLRDMKLAWLLQGIKVHFERSANITSPIRVDTGAKNMKGFISERCCIVSQDGETVAKTVAAWFMIETDTMKLHRIDPSMESIYGPEDFGDDFFSYKKPAILKDAETIGRVKISRKEIDTNMHLNNQKGAELLMDGLPLDFTFTDMNVLYRSSAYLGDELELCRKELENGYYVHLSSNTKGVCVAGVFENNK